MNLLQDVHVGLKDQTEDFICQGKYEYYHYVCDGVDDRGWGCGYRTLQTLCSWVKRNAGTTVREDSCSVPTITEIQDALVEMNDKEESFRGSKQWIGSFEVCLCLDYFYGVPCKIVHISKGCDIKQYMEELKEHFQSVGSPIMMGGETDNSSKGIMGVRLKDPALLVVDPHCAQKVVSPCNLQEMGFVKWMPLNKLHADSFYNLCLPKCRPRK